MRFMLLTILYFLAAFLNDKAWCYGGHTGNGGGTILCPDRVPVTLDYYEAQMTGKKLVSIETMDRQTFFKLMVKRLKLGSESKVGILGTTEIGGLQKFNIHKELENWANLGSPIPTWEEIGEWRVHDEFIEATLPPDCSFQQAAITSLIPRIGFRTFKIKGTIETLSPGQQLIMELHEFLQTKNSAGTSVPVRNLIGVMLQKKVNYRKMRLALLQFSYPFKEFSLKFGQIVEEDYSQLNMLGELYALDLRAIPQDQKSEYQKCPNWLGLSHFLQGDMVMLIKRVVRFSSKSVDKFHKKMIREALRANIFVRGGAALDPFFCK